MKKIGLSALLFVTLIFAACSNKDDMLAVTSPLNDFDMSIYSSYEHQEDEVMGVFAMSTYEDAKGKQIRIISEEAVNFVVDEAYLEEELTQVDELHVERTEILDIEGFGKVFGALIEDHQLSTTMFYYKFNVGENVHTILFVNGDDFTENDEAKAKTMITSLVLKGK